MEAAHTPASLARGRAAGRRRSCCSAARRRVLTMETVHDTDAVFEALEPIGLRAVVGKCMMDADRRGAERACSSRRAHRSTRVLRSPRAGTAAPTAGCAPPSRRALPCPARASCSKRSPRCRRERGLLVHTHASENRDEIALVRSRTGRAERRAISTDLGLASPRLCLAHCVWVDEDEQRFARRARGQGAALPGIESEARRPASRPSSRCARAASRSRSAPMARPATTSSTCSRRCGWRRRCRRSRAAPARCRRATSLRMATREGARALGLEREIGSIEAGKRADLIIVDRDRPHLATAPDPFSALVYAARPGDVRTTIVDGEILSTTSGCARGHVRDHRRRAKPRPSLGARAF